MKIELKNIKYFEQNTRQTYCFEAEVYINSKPCFMVENDGSGSAHKYFQSTYNDSDTFKLVDHVENVVMNASREQGSDLTLDGFINNLLEDNIKQD